MVLTDRLIRAIDWFVPVELQKSTATLWRARIFVISHVLGPFSAIAILGYLYRVQAAHDWVFWTLCTACGSFWSLPLALKLTRNLFRPALYSFCVLTFVSVFGSFFYGGVSSPFLPWFLTAQMLGFFYLGGRPFLVLSIIGVNLVAFSAAYLLNGSFPERVPIGDLSTVGMISVCAATLYSSMMAIYYAYVMTAQSALQEEIRNHLETAAKLRLAKHDAERANEGKAIFLAKMSHQLRTPLNAIIGYSELLLEDTEASEEAADAEELRSINRAGRHLLSLVSDVLHMPKIDAEDVDVTLRPVDLDHCLEEVSATCRNLIAHNGNAFAYEKDAVARSDPDRRDAPAADPDQLARQRGQIHQERQGGIEGQAPEARGPRSSSHLCARQWNRYSTGGHSEPLQEFQSGALATVWRHWIGARGEPAPCPPARRRDFSGESASSGIGLHSSASGQRAGSRRRGVTAGVYSND